MIPLLLCGLATATEPPQDDVAPAGADPASAAPAGADPASAAPAGAASAGAGAVEAAPAGAAAQPEGAGAEAALADRLLGPEAGIASPDPEVTELLPPVQSPWQTPLPFILGAVGLYALWWGQKRWQSQRRGLGSELRIVGRATLGGSAGLAVVEVRGREGLWRRLVVGTGDGAPRLVADLGEPVFGLLSPEPEVDEIDAGVGSMIAPNPEPNRDPAISPLDAPARAPFGRPSFPPFFDEDEPGATTLDTDARVLIEEVLGERRRKARADGAPTQRRGRFSTSA